MPKPTHPRSPGGFALDLLAAPFAPVFAIKRSWRTMRLLPAYGVHLAGIVAAVCATVLIDLARYGRSYFLQDLAYELESLFAADPDRLLIALAGFILFVLLFESAYLVTAWVLMPWGASPEPWRRSMNRGLVRLLQLTPFHALSMVALIFVMEWIDDHRGYRYYNYSSNRRDLFSYEFAMLLQAVGLLLYLASQLIVTLWAIAVHRDRPHWAAHSPWPAVCEGCGYQLVGMTTGRDCPECGKPVEHSLDSRRLREDTRSTFVKMFCATLRPYAFGQTLALYRPDKGYRRALWCGAGLLSATPILGFAGLFAILAIGLGEFDLTIAQAVEDYGQAAFVYIAVLGYTVVGSILLGLLGATLWGAYARLIRKRNALYPAAQGFAYQSGFFAFWALGYYPLIAIMFLIFDLMWSYNAPTPVWVNFLPLVFPAYTLAMMGMGLTLQGRLLAGARHGNG